MKNLAAARCFGYGTNQIAVIRLLLVAVIAFASTRAPPVPEMLAATTGQKNAMPALQQNRELKRIQPDNYYFSE